MNGTKYTDQDITKIVAKQNENVMLWKCYVIRIDEKRGKGKQTDIIKT